MTGHVPEVGGHDAEMVDHVAIWILQGRLDTLRFIKPVGIGDTIRARITAKRKVDRLKQDARGQGQGVVAWDVEVTNQHDELVASYDILTLVAKRSAPADAAGG